jgi:hypothetical protein
MTVAAGVGLLATLAAILVATLTPVGGNATVGGGFFCVRCGDAPLANLLRNVILFLPLGFFGYVVLRRMFGGLIPRPAAGAASQTGAANPTGAVTLIAAVTLLGAALSGGVETLQLFIPGRNPFVVDLLANTTGAALGGLLVATMPTWLRAAGPVRRRLFGAVLAGALLLAAAPAWLLVPAPPHEALWTQWNPPLGRVGPYAGAIVDARIGHIPLPAGPVPEAVDLPGRLLAGQTVALTLPAAVPVDETRGLFRINSVADGKVALAIAVNGTTVLATVGYRADWIGLTRPRVGAPGLLADAAPGDTVVLALTIMEDGALRLEAHTPALQTGRGTERAVPREASGADPSLGWSLLYYPFRIGARGTAALGFLWCGILLFAPALVAPTGARRVRAGGAGVPGAPGVQGALTSLGAQARPYWATAASGVSVLIVLAASPILVSSLAPLPAAGWAGAVTGWLLGRAARGRVDASTQLDAAPPDHGRCSQPQPKASQRSPGELDTA